MSTHRVLTRNEIGGGSGMTGTAVDGAARSEGPE